MFVNAYLRLVNEFHHFFNGCFYRFDAAYLVLMSVLSFCIGLGRGLPFAIVYRGCGHGGPA